MTRSNYAIISCLNDLVSHSAFFWLFAGTVSTGVASHLPEKHLGSYVVAVSAIFLTGVWQQSLRPIGMSNRGLSITTVKRVLSWLSLIRILVVARFILPLLSSRLGVLSRKPDLSSTMLWLGVYYLGIIGKRLVPLFLKHVLPSAEEVMLKDPRKPIIYLRSFRNEIKSVRTVFGRSRKWQTIVRNQRGSYFSFKNTFLDDRARLARRVGSARVLDEHMEFAKAFRQVGPYIAIGRPNEGFRDMDLSAAKMYVPDAEWQNVVRDWLRRCAGVVLEAGDSVGLGWEIEQVAILVPPRRLLLICPISDAEYESFLRAYSRFFPLGLPSTRPRSRLLIFNDDWRSTELRNIDFDAGKTLEPYFAQLRKSDAARA